MAVAVIMPRQGQSVESCIITEWKKKEGDDVKEGEVLFTYETDKASFEEEAKTSGTLLKILAQEGDDVPVLQNVAVIGTAGEDVSAFVETAQDSPQPSAEQEDSAGTHGTQTLPPLTAAHGVDVGGRIKASPRARMMASDHGIDIADVSPTGPKGRITERDVRALLSHDREDSEQTVPGTESPASTEAEYEEVKLSGVRKVIARQMHESLQTMAQLTNTASFDASEILAYRAKVKEFRGAMNLNNITLNDIVLFAVSRVLLEHSYLNAHLVDDSIRIYRHVNLGMAVDTPRGLLVPTIFSADTLTLNELAGKAKELAAKAQEGAISPDLLTGATFTVTNLGSFGIESFTPVINPPQTGILGVNAVTTRVKDVDGAAVPYKAMALSLTYDHRAVDGAPASRFLQALCRSLENFQLLLAE